jgi:nucleotidyltransferase/DNA polymerase involved in DNA repair
MIAQSATGPAQPSPAAHSDESRHSFAAEFAGVPKPALRAVFGKRLGQRLWETARRQSSARQRQAMPAAPTLPALPVAGLNTEILRGMIEYLSRRASETLDHNRRQANAVTLTLHYADSTQESARVRLARPTTNPQEISEAVSTLFHNFETREPALESINLSTNSIPAECVLHASPELGCAALADARS